jgi:hypothetical protein
MEHQGFAIAALPDMKILPSLERAPMHREILR